MATKMPADMASHFTKVFGDLKRAYPNDDIDLAINLVQGAGRSALFPMIFPTPVSDHTIHKMTMISTFPFSRAEHPMVYEAFKSTGIATEDEVAALEKINTKTLSTKKTWGNEGQYDYCVTLGNADDSSTIYRQLRSLLPIDQTGTPPVMIKANHQRAKTIAPISDPVPPLPDDRL